MNSSARVKPATMDVAEEFNSQADEFLRELASSILEIESSILEFTTAGSASEKIEKLTRQVHSVKGSALGFGFDLISSICHNFEDRITSLRIDSRDIEPELDGLLRHVDFLRGAVLAYRNRDHDAISQMRMRLRRQNAPSQTAENAAPAFDRRLRVLLIEKMGALLLLLNQAMKRYDATHIEIAVARDGYEGFGRLLKEKFDCVVMSNRSECLKGTELIHLIETVDNPNPRTPFILLTSDTALAIPQTDIPVFVVPKGDDLRSVVIKHLTNLFGEPRKFTQVEQSSYQNVLLVDDSIVIHRLVEMALKRVPDLNLRFASNGTDALAAIAESRPDLVLLDYQMPGMDGIELATRIRNEYPGVPFVFLTAADSEADQQRLRSVKPLSILKKPFPPRDLPMWLATLPKSS